MFSGQINRQFRRRTSRLAASIQAIRNGKSLESAATTTVNRAMKFPIDLTGCPPITPKQFRREYEVIAGFAPGSLNHYLLTLHNVGFRLFGSAATAFAFEQQTLMQQVSNRMQAGFLHAWGEAWPEFTFDKVVTRLKSTPRNTGGKDVRFTPEIVTEEWLKTVYGTKAKSAPPRARQAISTLAEQLTDALEGWAVCRTEPETAMAVIDDWFTGLTGQHAGLAASYNALPSRPPEIASAPVTLDCSLPAYPVDEECHLLPLLVGKLLFLSQENGKPNPNALSEMLVTQNSNALSWLFGNGWCYFATTSVETVAQHFQVACHEQWRIEAVCQAARAIPMERTLFGEKHYASYRSSVGGKLTSWASNYLNRLADWEAAMEAMPTEPFVLPAALFTAQGAYLFSGMDVDAEGLQQLLQRQFVLNTETQTALARLSGQSTVIPDQDDIKTIAEFIAHQELVSGRLNLLHNRIQQEIRLAKNMADQARIDYALSCLFFQNRDDDDLPVERKGVRKNAGADWLAPLKRVPRYSGGTPDVAVGVAEATALFNQLRLARTEHQTRIEAWLAEQNLTIDPMAQFAHREAEHMRRAGKTDEEVGSPQERAQRHILSRFLNKAKYCQPATVKLVADRLITRKAFHANHINTLLFNQKGEVFRSLFARSRHQPYQVANLQVLLETDWLDWMKDIVAEVWRLAEEGSTVQSLRDALELERAYQGITLSGLPDTDYPVALVKPADQVATHLNMSAGLTLLLTHGTVKAEAASKVFNHYYSAMYGATHTLFAQNLFVRNQFARVGQNELVYALRDNKPHWTPTKKLFVPGCESPLRGFIEHQAIRLSDTGAVDLAATLASLKNARLDVPMAHYLRQAPHEWRINLGLSQEVGVPVQGVTISKEQVSGKGTLRPATIPSLRLVGDPAYKTYLDRTLNPEQNVVLGDWTLEVTHHYRQSVTVQESGLLQSQVEFDHLSLCAILPFSEKVGNTTDRVPLSGLDRAVSIDLGECSIGYAVFNCRTGKPIMEAGKPVAGILPVPQIRSLIQTVKRYRHIQQPSLRFGAVVDARLEKLRNNVVGEVLRLINGLCEQYNGFPILESTVGNFETGAAQLSQVYQSVLSHYLYFNVDAQKRKREHYWYGMSMIQHPYLQVAKVKEVESGAGKKQERKLAVEPLNLFPGAGVTPAGTSQRCSKCGTNPIKHAFNLELKKNHILTDVVDGIAVLPDGMQFYLSRRGDKGRFIPLDATGLKEEELIRAIRQSLRRPQPKGGRRDTTQSWYVCANAACRHEMHADQNAAINIGDKFFDERVKSRTENYKIPLTLDPIRLE